MQNNRSPASNHDNPSLTASSTSVVNSGVRKQSLRLTKEREFALKIAEFLMVGGSYMCGYLFRDAYFHLYRLDPGMFVKATPEYFVYGGYAAYQAATALLTTKSFSTGQVMLAILVTAFGTGAYFGAITLVVERLSKIVSKKRNPAAAPHRISAWIKNKIRTNSAAKTAFNTTGMIIFIIYVIVFGCVLTGFLYAIPNLIANVAAEKQYSHELSEYANGCEDREARLFCFAVQDSSGGTIARGFLIATATDYAALSDDGRTRVVSLQARQLVQLDMPVSASANVPVYQSQPRGNGGTIRVPAGATGKD